MYISELYMWILCPERPIGEDTFMSFMWSCNGKRSSICKINRDKNAIQYGRNYRNLRPSRTFKQKADAAGCASPLGLRSSRCRQIIPSKYSIEPEGGKPVEERCKDCDLKRHSTVNKKYCHSAIRYTKTTGKKKR